MATPHLSSQFNRFSVNNHKDVAQKDLLLAVTKARKSVRLYQQFFISEVKATLLEEQGILTDPDICNLHPHAATKTIETYMLINNLLPILNKATTCIFMKTAKFNHLKRNTKIPLSLINKKITARDSLRYTETPNAIKIETPSAFIHDSLHYLSPADILVLFENNKNLETLFASCIIPPETIKGYKSMYPDIYDFEYLANTLLYIPDSDRSGAYEQPLNAHFWLQTNIIHSTRCTISVTKINSIFANHLFMFKKHDSIVAQYNCFQLPALIKIPKVHSNDFPITHPFLPQGLVKELLIYTQRVKTCKKTDLWAKIHQTISKKQRYHLDYSAMALLVDAIEILSKTEFFLGPPCLNKGILDYLYNSSLGYLKSKTIGKLYARITSTLMNLCDEQPLSLNFPLYAIQVNDSEIRAARKSPLYHRHISKPHYKIKDKAKLALETFLNVNDPLYPIPPHPPSASQETKIPNQDQPEMVLIPPPRPIKEKKIPKFPTPPSSTTSSSSKTTKTKQAAIKETIAEQKKQRKLTVNKNFLSRLLKETTEDQSKDDLVFDFHHFDEKDNNFQAKHYEIDYIFNEDLGSSDSDTSSEETESNLSFSTLSFEIASNSSAPNIVQPSADSTASTSNPPPIPISTKPPSYQTLPSTPKNLLSTPKPISKFDIFSLNNTCGLFAFLHKFSRWQVASAYYACRKEQYFSSTCFPNFTSPDPLISGHFPMLSTDEMFCLADKLKCVLVLHQQTNSVWQCVTDSPDSELKPGQLLLNIYNQSVHWQHTPIPHKCIVNEPHQPPKICTYCKSRFADSDKELCDLCLPHIGGAKNETKHKSNPQTKTPKIKEINKERPIYRDELMSETDPKQKIFKTKNIIVYTEPLTPLEPPTIDNADQLQTFVETQYNFKFKNYVPNVDAAKRYVRHLKNGITGMLLRSPEYSTEDLNHISSIMDREVDLADEVTQPEPIKAAMILGQAGSGKSSGLYSVLKKNANAYLYNVIVPRQFLRDQWRDKIKPPSDCSFILKTFETAMLSTLNNFVIADEGDLFPHGYFDLLCIHFPTVSHLLILADHMQNTYHDPHPQTSMNMYAKTTSLLAETIVTYFNFTFRLPKVISSLYGIKTFSKIQGFITQIASLNPDLPLFVPSEVEVNSFRNICRKTFTYASTQGLDFDEKTPVQIGLSMKTFACGYNSIYNATTRSKAGLFLYFIDSQFMNYNDKINANPLLKALLSLVPQHTPHEEKAIETLPQTYVPRTTLPKHTFREKSLELTEKIPPKHTRELKVKGKGFTNQFHEDREYLPIFPQHQNKDEATYWLTIEKRLSKQSKEKNIADHKNKAWLGTVLFESFKALHQLKTTPFDEDMFLDCINENELNKLSKPLQTLINNSKRADTSIPFNFSSIFLKSQLCTKLEKMFTQAKAGQTLACFQDSVILTLGPVVRYLERVVLTQSPPNIYTNVRKPESDLQTFILNNWKDQTSTINDYTAYDQTQNGEFLEFEMLLMKFFQIPSFFISFYYDMKVDVQTFLGCLETMRLTGEPPTFLFNTFANQAATNLKYDLSNSCPNAVQVYGGDDMAINEILNESPTWSQISKFFKLDSKTEKTKYPTFCGWYLTEKGIYKSPKLLFARLLTAIELNKEKEAKVSYALDHRFTYLNLENLLPYIPVEEQEYIPPLNNWFLKKINLKKLFETVKTPLPL